MISLENDGGNGGGGGVEVPVREDIRVERSVFKCKEKKKEQMRDMAGHERVRWIEMSGG